MSTEHTVAPYPPTDGTQPCAAEDPELFFVSSSSMGNYFQLPRALDVCKPCPFRRACLAYALTHDVSGVWGGTTENERARIRRQHGIAAEPVHTTDAAAREEEIAQLLRRGETPADVARAVGVSNQTVNNYIRRSAAS
ncbi:WhiB family transcriptional regulator [Nocardioides sp. SOB77]|uniref:WhiB family transcriptional regulator n=1 Tax=Nocardioides oceani TaxID=3058369 RepID=A0ABT8FGY1_9ACTN|nr:WhiB family transcriptional regulator [Nocardioides oceani]MDN4173948.1 WhiB family transcriptional regulator [Nocardioides oceani]